MARAPQTTAASEPLPEADRLEGFPHPRDSRDLFGHQAAEAALARAVAAGSLHHGWLIVGPEGIGKATLAYRLAIHLLARAEERDRGLASLVVDEAASAARQVRALAHPELLLIRRQYDPKAKRFATGIAVDDVRRLRAFLTLTAVGSGWRVVIVDSADDLNLAAANALLKALEEPPPRTVFLLVAAEPGRLLATIRSRCRTLKLEPLGRADLERAAGRTLAAAGQAAPADDQGELRLALAAGSVRRLLRLSGSDGLKPYLRVRGLLETLPEVDWEGVHALADDISSLASEARYEQALGHLLDILRRLIATAAGAGCGIEAERALAGRLVGSGGLATFAELWETVVRDKAEVEALNLDRKTFILDVFRRLAAAVRR
jgi:DNA polymerase-3 subunit delta'